MRKSLIYVCVVLLTLSAFLIGCGATQETNSSTAPSNNTPSNQDTEAPKPKQEFEMILTSEVPDTHFKSGLMKYFAEEITKRTDGGIKAQFFAAGQLYSDIDALRSLGTGAVHSVWPVSVQLESFNPAYGVLTLPFAVTDENMLNPEYRDKFLNVLSPLVQPNGMKVFGLLRTADLLFISQKKEMSSYEDIRGMKVRMTGGKVLLEMAKQLNASAVSIPASEMSTSLSQGVVDAVFTSPSGWKTILGPTVKNGFLIPGMNVQTYSIVVDDEWFNGLPQEYQDEISTLIVEVASDQWKKSIDDDQKVMDELIQEGVTVNTETPENIEELKKKFQSAYDIFASEFPDVYKQFVDLNQ